MIDRLLAWWHRPLEDPERRRLATLAALGLVALATLLITQQRTQPEGRPAASPAPPPLESQPPARVAQSAERPREREQDPEREERYEPTPADVAGAKRAARRFLTGYLPYTYGRGDAQRIRNVDPALREQLARQPPRVPLTVARKARPRVTTVQAETTARERTSVLALVADGKRRYTITLGLERGEGQWRVIDVAS